MREKALPLIFSWLLKKSQKIEKICLKFEKLFLINAIKSEVFSMLELIKKVHLAGARSGPCNRSYCEAGV